MLEVTCQRCGGSWRPRTDNPKCCPNCKTRIWNSNMPSNCTVCLRNFMMLHLHHIDGDKSNNENTNLIWLCEDCHSRVHNDFSNYVSHKKRIRDYENESDGPIKIKLKELRDKWLCYKNQVKKEEKVNE